VALVGGGSPPRPGEISLAHNGVLFLDELPEFARAALEALREPLENGTITIARAAMRAQFPARFQLIAAMNPCPCGYLGAAQASKPCRCSHEQVARYHSKLSGPLLDRIDLHVQVNALSPEALLAAQAGESSAVMAERVAAAQAQALARQGCTNQQLSGQSLNQHCDLAPAASQILQAAAQRLQWSGRATHRSLKVARTIADLSGSPRIEVAHMAEALQYRSQLLQR
jgi:magnesium chelatase family protein